MASSLHLYIISLSVSFSLSKLPLYRRTPVILDYSPPSWSHLNLITSVKTLFSSKVTFWHILGVRKPASLWERGHSATHITSLRAKPTSKVKREPGKEMVGLQASVRDPFPGLKIVKPWDCAHQLPQGSPSMVPAAPAMGRVSAGPPRGTRHSREREGPQREWLQYSYHHVPFLFLRCCCCC